LMQPIGRVFGAMIAFSIYGFPGVRQQSEREQIQLGRFPRVSSKAGPNLEMIQD